MAKRRITRISPKDWNVQRLRELLAGISRKKILVIGDVGVDRYTIGTVERISPEAPVPIVLVEEEKHKLGLAANVADNVQALGGVALLTGIVGLDGTAGTLRALLKESGVSSSHLVAARERRTVLKERIVSERQQLLRVDYETALAINASTEAKMLAKIRSLMKRADAVILEDYAKGLISQRVAREVFAMARRAGKLVAVDPNSKTPPAIYRGASILTPNTKEAEKLADVLIHDEASLLRAGESILEQTKARYVVITRGKEGMAIFGAKEGDCQLIPTYAREVYDVSGAGDTVISVLTMALAAGATIEEAAILGNLAAGVEVAKRGTATVSPDEVRTALEFFATMAV